MVYRIKTEKFEGPLDVLLNLIEERKLSINEVSLSEVCNKYIMHLKSLSHMPGEEVSYFLVVASTLMLIKSRTLIPVLELTEEEKESIEDLEERLRLLKEFRRLSKYLQEYSKDRGVLFSREAFSGYQFGFLPPQDLNAEFLRRLASGLIEKLPLKEVLPEKVVKRVISIEEKTKDLLSRIQDSVSGSLEKIISAKDRVELIVGFLAVLELIKQGFLEVDQKNIFGEVELKKVS